MANGPQPRPWYKALLALVVEVWAGSILFAVIFAPAIALDQAIKWLGSSTTPSKFLLELLIVTKYAISVLDAVAYLAFMTNMTWRFVLELRWRGHEHS